MTKNPGMQAYVVPPQEAVKYFDDIRPSMRRALDRRSDWSVDNILEKIRTGEVFLWVVTENGSYVGHVSARIRKEELVVITLGGVRAKEWMPLVQEQILYLMEQGIITAAITGARRGMEKWLKEMGWKTYRVILELKQGED